MTQTQMTAYLADKIGITKRQAKSTFDELNDLVTKQLRKEGSLRLAGLGIFRKRKLKARVGRNPATGEQIKIPARTRLRFTPAKALKDSVLGARYASPRHKQHRVVLAKFIDCQVKGALSERDVELRSPHAA